MYLRPKHTLFMTRGALGFVVLALFCFGFSAFYILKLSFAVCRCCSRFFSSFITHTLHAAPALERYTDIAVSVFNDFGHSFVVFGAFCCDFAVFATPQCPLHDKLPISPKLFCVSKFSNKQIERMFFILDKFLCT